VDCYLCGKVANPLSPEADVGKLKMLRGKPETRPMSDSSKLAWQEFFVPTQAAAAQLNAAISAAQNTIAKLLLKSDGLDPSEWVLDMDNLRYVKRPPNPEG
jgi:hypothetical protein